MTSAVYVAIWQLASMLVNARLLLPSPLDTLHSLLGLITTSVFWTSIAHTLLRVLAGFLSGMAAGTLLAVVCAASDAAHTFLSPIRSIIKATPVTSFILLVILWLSSSISPAFIAFVMVTPIFWGNVYQGILSADKPLVDLARLYGLSLWNTLKYAYAPSAIPQFISACGVGLGFAWKSCVAAEVLARPEFAIGSGLYDSKLYIEIPELFAWTAAVIILSRLLELFMMHLIECAVPSHWMRLR